METYAQYKGLLPRYDGEVCPYDEFDIFFVEEDGEIIQVNDLTEPELIALVQPTYSDDMDIVRCRWRHGIRTPQGR